MVMEFGGHGEQDEIVMECSAEGCKYWRKDWTLYEERTGVCIRTKDLWMGKNGECMIRTPKEEKT